MEETRDTQPAPRAARGKGGRALRIEVIVNPAAGADKPVLSTLNTAFAPAGVDWDVSVTKRKGDALNYARKAVEAGVDVVAAYGGDGTVREVAGALVGTDVPLAVFPGGTANALAVALNIPSDLAEACALAFSSERDVIPMDVGRIGDEYFLIAMGIGIPGAIAEAADREAKDRLGMLAYALQTIEATRQTERARYHVTVDGRQHTSQAVACVIANSGNFGIPGLSLSSRIDPGDGLLDVILLHNSDINSIVSFAASLVMQNQETAPYEHWQGREIEVTAEPPQPIQVDGEVIEPGPVRVQVIPRALRIIIPRVAT